MEQMKEISADQVLTLLFISLGNEAIVSFKDIDRFFDILIEVGDKNPKASKCTLGINMPMHENYDEKLFNEILQGDDVGKIKLADNSSLRREKIIKDKLIWNFVSLVGSDKEFKSNCQVAIRIFNEEYNQKKCYEEDIQKITGITFLEKVKGLVKHK